MVSLVETMRTTDNLQPTVCGLDENQIQVAEGAAYGSRPTADDLQ